MIGRSPQPPPCWKTLPAAEFHLFRSLSRVSLPKNSEGGSTVLGPQDLETTARELGWVSHTLKRNLKGGGPIAAGPRRANRIGRG
ncbi:hypothetical protein HPP92_020860 [Vanilla planifolia]|uniref:Uncharacterized protein n=1 Tax=Vanilla planifolia TaxID=51239 RepID=A0A835UGM7_VANPL|nr:hypothetical protein HPP92_021159 [Vanilla planifolia]KAG0462384.1 hypothetical protein HPP92_020860 [Vanilla planifolia]